MCQCLPGANVSVCMIEHPDLNACIVQQGYEPPFPSLFRWQAAGKSAICQSPSRLNNFCLQTQAASEANQAALADQSSVQTGGAGRNTWPGAREVLCVLQVKVRVSIFQQILIHSPQSLNQLSFKGENVILSPTGTNVHDPNP